MKHPCWRAAVAGIWAAFLVTMAAAVTPAAAQTTKCEPGALATKYPSVAGKTFRIGQDGESPPYSFRDPKDFNNVIGFDADLARAVLACLGGKVEFKIGGWSGLLPAVIAGQSDAMWDNLYYTAERAKLVDYISYMTAGTGILTKKGNPKNIHSVADACGMSATAVLGTVEEAAFRDQSKKCVAEGKAEINILATDSNGQLERAVKIVSNFKIGVAIKKGRDDVVTAFHDALVVVQNDGTQKALYEKYKID